MTAYGSGSRAIEAMRAGADDYVQKPIDPDALVPALRRAIERRRMPRNVLRFGPGERRDAEGDEPIVGTSPVMQETCSD